MNAEEYVVHYWINYYTNKHLCSLCGQSGVIDTRGLKTPADVEVGRRNWCICPNGQSLRRQVGGVGPE